MGFTEFYWVLLGFTGFYWVLLGFTGFYWVPLGFVLEHGHRLAHLLKRYLTAGRHRKPSSSMGLARQRRRSSGENVSCWNFYAGRFHHLPIGWPVRVGLGRLALVRFRSPQRSRSGRVGCAESKRNRPASGHDFIRPAVQLWKSAAGCRIPPRNPFRFLHLVWWFSFSFGQRWPNEWSQKLSAAVGRAHYGNSVLVRCWYERRAGWRASSFLLFFFGPGSILFCCRDFYDSYRSPWQRRPGINTHSAVSERIFHFVPPLRKRPQSMAAFRAKAARESPASSRASRFRGISNGPSRNESLLGFTGFYWVSLGFTGFYFVLPGFTGFLPSFTAYYWVLLRITGFYRVLLGFTAFHWVLLGVTGFYWALPGFTGFY